MTTARRIPRKLRRARRAAAFHADRAAKASTPLARYRASVDALVSAAKHAKSKQAALNLREEVAEHVDQALEAADLSENSRALYVAKLIEPGTDVQRLGKALMCLQGAINHMPGTERDRLFEFYSQQFSAEAGRIDTLGGVR